MGDNVCVSHQKPPRDWWARIPKVDVEVGTLYEEMCLTSKAPLVISCRNRSFWDPCSMLCWWMGEMELSLFGPNISLDIALSTVYRLLSCELDV